MAVSQATMDTLRSVQPPPLPPLHLSHHSSTEYPQDVYHTHFSLAGLALLELDPSLAKMDPVLCLPLTPPEA